MIEPDPLSLPPGELRRLGHRVVDLVVGHLEGLRDQPPIRTGTPAELDALLREPPPEAPGDADAALDLLAGEVLTRMQHGDHPRFFARVPSPSNGVGALGDALAAGFNAFAGSWAGGSGPAALELVVLDWLRELCGLADGTEGILVSGGSVAALTALATARHERPGDVAYVSDQTHASNTRALRILGVPHIRVLPSDDDFRLTAESVRAALAEDRRAGLQPFCAIATAGTTNTGAVDALGALADLCRAEDLWLHVDGAYGAPAALTARGRALLAGAERADSLSLDPHKWLFQPYEAGCLLVRRPGALQRTFAMAPEYLRDVLGDEVNFRDRGPQLSRGARAVKLWLTFKTFGVAAMRAGIERGMGLAERAQAALEATGGWEIVTPAQLAIVTFRAEGDDAVNARLVERAVADGYAAPSSTVLRGRTVLRLCTINPRTTDAEIDETVARLSSLRA